MSKEYDELEKEEQKPDVYAADTGFEKDSFVSFEEVEPEEPKTSRTEIRYDEIFDISKRKTVGFSIASMVLGILSVICCCLTWAGLIMGIAAIVFAVISRKSLGYFDGMTIAGLILGIFGTVFGIAVIVISYALQDIMNELLRELEEMEDIPIE